MGFLESFFGRRKLFSPQASDLDQWRTDAVSDIKPPCDCLKFDYKEEEKLPSQESKFHLEEQVVDCEAWRFLEVLIEKAILDKAKEFSPRAQMTPEMWSQIITLPASIAKLKSVRKLYLYGSHLVRIPPEIGEMENLEEFDAYTSYRLHWLPYEITRCKKLTRSRISTRALYGNYKNRLPFPKLGGAPKVSTEHCSVCREIIQAGSLVQVWITLKVAADILPLLVNACSEACVIKLPAPASGYVDHPHKGGFDLRQPPTTF